MAIGDNYNNNQQQYKPTVNVTSGYKWYNEESTIDPTRLLIKMWGNSLILEISPKKAESSTEFAEYDDKSTIKLYLSHTKARILHDEILGYLDNREERNSSGVPSGTGVVTICNGSEFGSPEATCLVLRRVNESGETESSYAYEFKRNYHYAIRNYDADNKSFSKEYEDYNDLEIRQFLTLLEEYYTSMANTTAFSVLNAMNYDYKTNSKIDAICEAVNAKVPGKGGNHSKGSNRSYFDSKSTSSGGSTTVDYDSIESAMEY